VLTIHPIVRLLAPLALGATAFWIEKLLATALVYAVVLGGLLVARLGRKHLLFLLSTLPLLAALMLIWGWAIPPGGSEGVQRALRLWLRICIIGGAFQWMLLPLVGAPLHLRMFMDDVRLPHWASLLLITPVLFLPEVRRRIDRVVEARKAQGLPASGMAGLRALPEMIAPLVASLLETSLGRAELWSHRNLLAADYARPAEAARSVELSLLVAVLSLLAIGVALWI
jgi:energy-coupling factor transporter transmembrane protein EcfT